MSILSRIASLPECNCPWAANDFRDNSTRRHLFQDKFPKVQHSDGVMQSIAPDCMTKAAFVVMELEEAKKSNQGDIFVELHGDRAVRLPANRYSNKDKHDNKKGKRRLI